MSPNPSCCTVAAILLLLGAELVIDPGTLDKLGENLVEGIRTFDNEIRGFRPRNPWRQFQRPAIGSSKTAGRLWGAAFIAAGLLIAAVA